MAAIPPPVDLTLQAPDFSLLGTDGEIYTLSDVAGENGTVIAFICNHCPYVVAVIDRLVDDAKILSTEGVGFAAICSNDARAYPDDSFENMGRFAKRYDFGFPYLHDESQAIARAYGAVCTPDLYGFDAAGHLKYRGRLDEGRMGPPPPGSERDLLQAMRMISETGEGPQIQIPSMGCSIKWKM